MNRLRIAAASDAEAIQAIYAPVVVETPISFETEIPTVEEMRGRIETTLPQFPWLVAEGGGSVIGYAYASPHHERAAYQWSADVSVYVAQAARRKGIARELYEALLGMLEDQGYYTAFAGIALPNAASVTFHESMGFRPVGIYHNAGYKLGAWHDVGWWERPLRECGKDPRAPIPFAHYGESASARRRLAGQRPDEPVAEK